MALDRILVVDDEDLIRWSLQQKLSTWGYRPLEASNAETAIALVESESPDLVLLDVHLPDKNGLEVLKAIKEWNPRAAVIIMTAYGVLEDAVAALRLGAYDFVSKPLNFEELRATIANALETVKLRQEVRHFRDRDRKRFNFENLVGESEPIRNAIALMKKVAASPATTILFQGESGTGKDLFAKAIHFYSFRADRPFLAVNCAALPENLVESELFGYERGAFTDARQQKKGLLELADGGTLFLDEIGEMPLGLQAKLLRVLEEQSFKRVGGVQDVRVDVRIIASSNRDLKKMVDDEKFRTDLFYRLNVMTINLPPLRERGDDVKLLCRHFVNEYNARFGKNIAGLTPDAERLLSLYHWPGNVRELRNLIERAMLLEEGTHIGADVLPIDVAEFTPREGGASLPDIALPEKGTSLEKVEEELLRQALSRTRGNQTRAAKLLNISRDALRYKMKKFQLQETGH
jgi:DNA-binding NtrC family response regulator